MSFKVQRIRARARFGLRSLVVGILLWPASAWPRPIPTVSPSMSIQAKLVKLPAKVSTIVVRKSADCGRDPAERRHHRRHRQGLRRDQFHRMDRNGEVLVDRQIQVEGPTDQLVTVYRGRRAGIL